MCSLYNCTSGASEGNSSAIFLSFVDCGDIVRARMCGHNIHYLAILPISHYHIPTLTGGRLTTLEFLCLCTDLRRIVFPIGPDGATCMSVERASLLGG